MARVNGASPCNSASAARQSAALPRVSRKASGRPLPSLTAWILVLRPPRPTPSGWALQPLFHQRHSDVPSHGCCRAARGRLTHLWRPGSRTPSASPLGRPAHEAIIQRLARPILGRHVDPPPARLQRHHDAADHTPVVHTGHAPRFVRQQRCKPLPLCIA